MSKKTKKNKYQSRYSPNGYVHAAQYITEVICEKQAALNNKDLPIKFWTSDEWLKIYRYQIMLANRLLKKYSEYAIIAALRDKRMWKTYSLRGSFLEKIVQEYQRQQDLAKKISKEVEYNFIENPSHESNNNKTSIISKLKALDD